MEMEEEERSHGGHGGSWRRRRFALCLEPPVEARFSSKSVPFSVLRALRVLRASLLQLNFSLGGRK
jgi:hypothetical protein